MNIVAIDESTVDAVVSRVQRLFSEASTQGFVNAEFDRVQFATALLSTPEPVWVALDGEVVGHIHAAILESDVFGHGAWIAPDGVSFDSPQVLADLYAHAAAEWAARGVVEHFVWIHEEKNRHHDWLELGFHFMHRRGMMHLPPHTLRPLPDGYQLRRGGVDDLATAIELADKLQDAQSLGPSFSFDLPRDTHDDLGELLEEPDSRLWIVESHGVAVASCITFPLPPRRDTPEGAIHLSAVVVDETHRGRGIGTSMVDAALHEGVQRGFAIAETNWRVPHRLAADFWPRYGFTPTALRLHRTVGRF